MAIGGTITELKARMTAREFSTWCAYRLKHGPMNDVRRYDRPAAMISFIASKLMGGKAKMQDFMPFAINEAPAESDFNEVTKALKGLKIGKSR